MNIADIEDADMEGPTKFGLHAVEGFGKTFLASHFPSPVWIAPENGFPRDLPTRPRVIKCKTWQDVKDAVVMLTDQPHDYQTLVFDTMDWVEPMVHAYVCERDSGRKTEMNKGGNKLISIEDYGYARGFIAAEEELRTLIPMLDTLQHRRRVHVVMLMHSRVAKFENPSGQNFDRWEPKMHARFSGVIKEYVENLLFGKYEVFVDKLDEKDKKAKGVSSGKRLLGTRHNAAYDAKNRVKLPEEVEFDDPMTLIPYLLGEHMIESAPPRTEPRREPAREQAFERKTKASPESAGGRDAYDGPRPVPPGAEGKPAHHETRAGDEQQRQDAALAKTRAAGAEASEAQRTRDAAAAKEREAQGWTEPRRAAPQTPPPAKPDRKAKGTPPPPSAADPVADRFVALNDLLGSARKNPTLGDKYANKVEKWIKMANGEVEKIDTIIEDVKKTLGAAVSAA